MSASRSASSLLSSQDSQDNSSSSSINNNSSSSSNRKHNNNHSSNNTPRCVSETTLLPLPALPESASLLLQILSSHRPYSMSFLLLMLSCIHCPPHFPRVIPMAHLPITHPAACPPILPISILNHLLPVPQAAAL